MMSFHSRAERSCVASRKDQPALKILESERARMSSRKMSHRSLGTSRFDEAIVTYPAPPDSMNMFPVGGLRFSDSVKGLVTTVRTFIPFALSDFSHGFLPRPTYCMTRTAYA